MTTTDDTTTNGKDKKGSGLSPSTNSAGLSDGIASVESPSGDSVGKPGNEPKRPSSKLDSNPRLSIPHRLTKRPILDFLACLKIAGVQLKKNLLGDVREIKVGSDPWRDFVTADDGFIHARLQTRVKLINSGKSNSGKSDNDNKPYPATFPTTVRKEAYDAHFTTNCYHPVRDYFDSLPRKPDTDVARVLLHLFKIDSDDELDLFPQKHIDGYGEYWLVSLVLGIISRTYQPGAVYDLIPILRGEFGCGKSLLTKLLLPPKLHAFMDKLDLSQDHREIIMRCQQASLVEASELAGNRRKDSQDFKAFVSATNEMIRMPYDKHPIRIFRNFVIVGTTNDKEFLANDPTGDRRTLILPVGKYDANATENDVYQYIKNWLTTNRDKLFSHCLHLYQQGRRGLLGEFPQEQKDIRTFLASSAKRRNYELMWALDTQVMPYTDGKSLKDIREQIAKIKDRRIPLPDDSTLSSALKDKGYVRKRVRCKDTNKQLRLWYPPGHDPDATEFP